MFVQGVLYVGQYNSKYGIYSSTQKIGPQFIDDGRIEVVGFWASTFVSPFSPSLLSPLSSSLHPPSSLSLSFVLFHLVHNLTSVCTTKQVI